MLAVAAASNAAGIAFLKTNGEKEGVITTASGLQYSIMTNGEGTKSPLVGTPCECHYAGRLIDGTEFDSSIKRGRPSTFAPNQVIKGWTELSGKTHEEVFDVACSDGNKPDPQTNRCPDNGADVNLKNCEISKNVGANELKTVWKDPKFDSSIKSFYYVRVLENPTCRWSTWDALKSGNDPRPDIPSVIQERAWSSPIWYVPNISGIRAANILPDDV